MLLICTHPIEERGGGRLGAVANDHHRIAVNDHVPYAEQGDDLGDTAGDGRAPGTERIQRCLAELAVAGGEIHRLLDAVWLVGSAVQVANDAADSAPACERFYAANVAARALSPG